MRPRTYYMVAIVSLLLIVLWLHIALLPEGGLISIATVLISANLWWLLPAFGLFAVAYVLRAIRWWLLLRPFQVKGNPATLFPMLVGGIFLTYVVPLRAGDVASPYWLRERTGTRFTAGLASILLARFLDFASLTLIVVLGAILVFGGVELAYSRLLLGALVAGAFVAFFLLIRSERFVNFLTRVLSRLFKPSERLRQEVPAFVENAAKDLHTSIASWNTGLAFLTSVPLWLLETAKLTFLGLALGVDIPIPLSCFVASTSYVGGHLAAVLIPAGIGIFVIQAFTLSGWLSMAGISVAASVALLDGLIYVSGLTITGVPSIAAMGRGYRELQSPQEEESREPQT